MNSDKLNIIVNNFRQQFTTRILTKANLAVFTAALDIELSDTEVYFKMRRDDVEHVLTIPIPFERNGVSIISTNGVDRAEGLYFWKVQNIVISYMDIIYEILFGYPVT